MHKGKVIYNITLKYIQNLAYSKWLSGLCESIFKMYDPDSMFL